MTRSRWMAAAAFGSLILAAAPSLAQQASSAPAAAPAAQAPASRGLSLKDLAMMERVSEPRVSPDGRQILYAVRSTDWEGNKGVNGLWLADVSGGEPRKLAISEGGASGARSVGGRDGVRTVAGSDARDARDGSGGGTEESLARGAAARADIDGRCHRHAYSRRRPNRASSRSHSTRSALR